MQNRQNQRKTKSKKNRKKSYLWFRSRSLLSHFTFAFIFRRFVSVLCIYRNWTKTIAKNVNITQRIKPGRTCNSTRLRLTTHSPRRRPQHKQCPPYPKQSPTKPHPTHSQAAAHNTAQGEDPHTQPKTKAPAPKAKPDHNTAQGEDQPQHSQAKAHARALDSQFDFALSFRISGLWFRNSGVWERSATAKGT